jgi:ATP-dependent RNA helicase DHX57
VARAGSAGKGAAEGQVLLQGVSEAPPFALLLFCGELGTDAVAHTITIDGRLSFRAPARVGVLLRRLRADLDRLLEIKLERPEEDIARSPTVQAIVQLLTGGGAL